MTIAADGVTDDTSALHDAIMAGTPLPAGTIRITQDLVFPADVQYKRGIKAIGDHMMGTTILADYDGDVDSGAVIRLEQAGSGHYNVGNVIRDLTIAQAPGRTGINGIQLTAAWLNEVKNVRILNLSGSGMTAPLRPDINPISDFYQSLFPDMERLWIAGCARFGIDFRAGQSPGCFRLHHSILSGNALGGLYCTTGQSEIDFNIFVGNGHDGTNASLVFATAEGPEFIPWVRGNEFDTNWNAHISLDRVRGARIIGNRFLSQTYETNDAGAPMSGGTFMRPGVHVKMAAQNGEVWRALFEQNYHRSVTGPMTTAPCIAYQAVNPSLLSQCRILYPDFGPSDGVNQNSTGFVPYDGIAGTDTQIVDARGLAPASPSPVAGVLLAAVRATVAQDVYSVPTVLRWDAIDTNAGNCMGNYTFRAPSAGAYTFQGNVKLSGMANGQTVQMLLYDYTASSIISTSNLTYAGGELQANLQVNLAAGEMIGFGLVVPAPTKSLNVQSATTNWLKVFKN